jgi:hypothetical protein
VAHYKGAQAKRLIIDPARRVASAAGFTHPPSHLAGESGGIKTRTPVLERCVARDAMLRQLTLPRASPDGVKSGGKTVADPKGFEFSTSAFGGHNANLAPAIIRLFCNYLAAAHFPSFGQ